MMWGTRTATDEKVRSFGFKRERKGRWLFSFEQEHRNTGNAIGVACRWKLATCYTTHKAG